jgi:hypothetical protein
MKLETSAKVRLIAAAVLGAMALVTFVPAVLHGDAAAGFVLGFAPAAFALLALNSWWGIRRRMATMDYQARAIGRATSGPPIR